MANYLDIVDDVIAEIRTGRLRAGDRLPPQRDFAYRRGIAASTAARVYGELVRRGVAAGEVGRGTFVRLMPTLARPALAEPTPLTIDLDLNFPTVPEQDALLAASLGQLAQRAEARAQAFAPASARGSAALRGIAATFLARPGWTPDPDSLLFAGSGKQAIAATLSALVSTGDRLGVEALTYPFVKDIARQLGIRLVPLALDGEGLVPEAVVAQQRQAPLKALYLQPTLHNPLGVSMSRERRARLAAVLRDENLLAVEDGIYAFLDDRLPPLKALAPERVALVDSLSKRLSPGLTVGFVMPPADAREAIVRALHTGAWVAPAFAQAGGTPRPSGRRSPRGGFRASRWRAIRAPFTAG
ncbi:putative HTH-type transcriptional regulator YdcR [bacterium YEK0313]|nr:putative HTH-type transcriptional regulator YdcR [bacterium YEK0313]